MELKINKDSKIVPQIIAQVGVQLALNVINEGIDVFKSSSNAFIEANDNERIYQNINEVLYELNPELYNKHRRAGISKDYFELNIGTNYYIKLKNRNFIRVQTYKGETKQYFERNIKVIFIGKDRHNIRKMFLKKVFKNSIKNKIKVEYLAYYGINFEISTHDFSNVVLENDVKERIINGLINWKNSKQWYEDHQMIHKIGVFLYGDPGTGKSTITKAISTMFNNAPILVINPNEIQESISDILYKRKTRDETFIVLIEDFDMIFTSREQEKKSKGEEENNNSNQNTVFQLLDGIFSTDNTIYIATTNHKDKLDPALIRYGRFDIQEELTYFDKERAIQATKLLGYDESLLEEMKIGYPIQPALLQSKIMEYRSKL